MKVKDLITKLQALERSDADVYVAVRTHTQAFPVAYEMPFAVEQWHDDKVKITMSLPESMHTVNLKKH